MNTQSLSPSFSFLQPFVKGFEHGQDHFSADKNTADETKSQRQHRVSEDLYQPSKLAKQESVKDVTSTTSLQSLVTNKSQAVDIQVQTQEGDTVTISFNQASSASQSSLYVEQGNSQLSIYQQNTSFQSSFSLNIEGDLNEDELQSLSALLDKMSEVSDEFFNGNVKTAFEHAQKVGFDTEQIAAFSLDLNMKSSVEAITAYQQVKVPEQNINTDLITQARDFLAETKDFMADSRKLLNSIAQPKQSFSDLFSGFEKIQQSNGEDKDSHDNTSLFLNVIENISNDIFKEKMGLLESEV